MPLGPYVYWRAAAPTPAAGMAAPSTTAGAPTRITAETAAATAARLVTFIVEGEENGLAEEGRGGKRQRRVTPDGE